MRRLVELVMRKEQWREADVKKSSLDALPRERESKAAAGSQSALLIAHHKSLGLPRFSNMRISPLYPARSEQRREDDRTQQAGLVCSPQATIICMTLAASSGDSALMLIVLRGTNSDVVTVCGLPVRTSPASQQTKHSFNKKESAPLKYSYESLRAFFLPITFGW